MAGQDLVFVVILCLGSVRKPQALAHIFTQGHACIMPKVSASMVKIVFLHILNPDQPLQLVPRASLVHLLEGRRTKTKRARRIRRIKSLANLERFARLASQVS